MSVLHMFTLTTLPFTHLCPLSERFYGRRYDNVWTFSASHFFRQIPHYHLEKATRHLYKFLDENRIEYKYRYTPYFFIDIFNYTMNHMSEVKYIY
jgi:hypothetical protein